MSDLFAVGCGLFVGAMIILAIIAIIRVFTPARVETDTDPMGDAATLDHPDVKGKPEPEPRGA